MKTLDDLNNSEQQQMFAVIADYLERIDNGENVDRRRIMRQHPDIAQPLEIYFETSDLVDRMAGPTVEESVSAESRTHSAAMQDTDGVTARNSAKPIQRTLPQQFGRYCVMRKLGEGAMGAVYLAFDNQLEREVALKTPSFENDSSGELLERFYREAKSAALLRHPGICPVHDVGEIDGIHYISMAYIEGRPLSSYVKPDKRHDERTIALLVRKLALALDDAHQKGVTHRDLKPANIMVDQRNEPIVMDFGLAFQAKRGKASRITRTGAIIGSPAYMSPEQVESQIDKIGPATDIYSLGVILYEMLAGRLPFEGTLPAVFGQIVSVDPRPPSVDQPDVDPRLEQICLKMMAKQPADRYPSMHDVADALSEVLATPIAVQSSGTAQPASDPSRDAKASQRHRTSASKERASDDPRAQCAEDVQPIDRWETEGDARARNWWQTAMRHRKLMSCAAGFLVACLVVAIAYQSLNSEKGNERSENSSEFPDQPSSPSIIPVEPPPPPAAEVKIEINDSDIQLHFDGKVYTDENNGEQISAKPGPHNLLVVYGEQQIRADDVPFEAGDNLRLRVEYANGYVNVALGEKTIAERWVLPVGPQLRATIPPVGGRTKFTGTLWHPGLEGNVETRYTVSLRCVPREPTDAPDHRRMEVDVVTGDFREQARLLIDEKAFSRGEFVVKDGYLLAGEPATFPSVAEEFDSVVDRVAQSYTRRGESPPIHRLSVHDVLAFLFDADLKTSQPLFRLLHPLLRSVRRQRNQGQKVKLSHANGVEVVSFETGAGGDKQAEDVNYRIALSADLPFSWHQADITFGQDNRRLFQATLEYVDSGNDAVALLPKEMLKVEDPLKIKPFATVTLPGKEGVWASYNGTLSYVPDPAKPAERISFDLKEILVKSLSTEVVDNVEYRWLEIDAHINDYVEVGRVLVNEERYRLHRRLEVKDGWVRHGSKKDKRVVRFDVEEDLLTHALEALDEESGSRYGDALPKNRLAFRDLLSLMFNARVGAKSQQLGRLRPLISSAMLDNKLERSVDANAKHNIRKGDEFVGQLVRPKSDVPIMREVNSPPITLNYAIHVSDKSNFGWVSADVELSMGVPIGGQTAKFPLFDAKLELVDFGINAKSVLPDNAKLDALEEEFKLVYWAPAEEKAMNALNMAKTIEKEKGKRTAYKHFESVVENHPEFTEGFKKAKAWLSQNKSYRSY